MPRPRRHGETRMTQTTHFQFEIPLQNIHEQELDCSICRNGFCLERTCGRTLARLECCENPICCKCLYKLASKCTCDRVCDKVISYCPYCRCVSPLRAIDIFLGTPSKRKCSSCDARDAAENEDADDEADDDGSSDDPNFTPNSDEEDDDDDEDV